MSKQTYVPWHQTVKLRDDVRSGDLSLAIFAADLYDVVMGRAKPIYQKPEEFFALTYPTFNLRELAKDVLLRLAGKNDRAVRQLQLTYGGGKTHSLITLYHLVNSPDHLPNIPAVHEFRQHAGGIVPPKARIAVLPFDKLDVEKGMEVTSPDGKTRWLHQPWSVLAFQIAGPDGLRLLHADGKNEERSSPPAENLLRELLALPARDGLSTLVLIDEVLTYAREKIGLDPQWRHRLQDFFQYLTQAATKVDGACVVASLLATNPSKSDALGKEIAQELSAIFSREREEGVQPVEKQDVAEILRRRFFTPASIKDRESFRSQVMAVLDGIQPLDEGTQKNRKAEEERYLASYPFHPDLTELFFTKWTQLEGFQRTRGVLRTFALALRDAEKWDTCPVVGANVLLNAPGKPGLSESARELTSIATSEEYEGKKQEWEGILRGELEKVQEIQKEFSALKGRELEQAVMATFLHSQPIGQRAAIRDLMVLLGASKPDRIELEKALLRWTEVSWWLDEAATATAETTAGKRELPKSWKLGTKPNLKQMHSQAVTRVLPELVEMKVDEFITKEKRLTAGGFQAGARVHNLSPRPRDVEDDGEFHYVVLGPKAASESGKPSAEARSFIKETTTADRPRTYQNAILLLVPSKDGLELLRNQMKGYLGWEEVGNMPEAKAFDDMRKALLKGYIDEARRKVPEAVVQAYSIVVTVSAKGEIEAFKITPAGEPLFETVKKDKRSRIQESAVSPEALLPDGPYNLWRPGETSRRASDLVRAFAQFPHLPKMLRQKDIAETLAIGTEKGYFVLRLTRPDKSLRTIWRCRPGETDLLERDLEVVLPDAAELTSLDSGILAPGFLPGLWPDNSPVRQKGTQGNLPFPDAAVSVAQVIGFFDGKHASKIPRQGYEEVFRIPMASREVVERAIQEAVKAGIIWLVSGPASFFKEEIPAGIVTGEAAVNPPPAEIPVTALLPQNLPAAWKEGLATGGAICNALAATHGKPLPWSLIARAISGAIQAGMLERSPDSAPWPCDWAGAANIRLRIPKEAPPPPPPPPPPPHRKKHTAEAVLEPTELQIVAEAVGTIRKASAGLDLQFTLKLELGENQEVPEEKLAKLNEALAKVCPKLKFEG